VALVAVKVLRWLVGWSDRSQDERGRGGPGSVACLFTLGLVAEHDAVRLVPSI
jgi:hypothetical protein